MVTKGAEHLRIALFLLFLGKTGVAQALEEQEEQARAEGKT
ncbi:MAG: hypothetical protein AAF471_01805 [Myxococcota bacterium]